MDRINNLRQVQRLHIRRHSNLIHRGREFVLRGVHFTHYYFNYTMTPFNEDANLIFEMSARLTALEQEAINLMGRFEPYGATMSVIVEINERTLMLNRIPSLEQRHGHEFGLYRRFRNVAEIVNDFIYAFSMALDNLAQSERQYDMHDLVVTFIFDVPHTRRAFGRVKKYILNAINSFSVTPGLAKYNRQASNYCGFFAIVFALARSENKRNKWAGSLNWFYEQFTSLNNMTQRLKSNQSKAKTLCHNLANMLNVDPLNGWDVQASSVTNTAMKFVQFQPRFQIVIYCEPTRQIMDNKKGILFDTQDVEKGFESTIFMSYTSGHLHLITDIFKFLGKSRTNSYMYCANCLRIVQNNQHPCLLRPQCDKCLVQFMNNEHENNHTKIANTGFVDCPKCERQFYNELCLSCHKCTTKIADCCESCGRKIGANHDCGKFVCRFCRKNVERGHVCFIEKLDDPKHSSAAEAGANYYAFDLETMTIDNTGKQVVNLICVARCFSNQEFLFYNMEDFVRWLEHLDGEDVCMFAHNLKGFDGRMVFEYLLQRCTPPQHVSWLGSKILQMSYGKIQFRDTLLHITTSLEKLPKMFGLDESKFKKGFFPHKFNVPANQEYVGPIPDKSYFSPEMMSPAKYREFEEWYALQTQTYSFKTELVEYCLSDTRILARAIEAYMQQQMQMKPFNPLSKLTIASYALAMYRTYFMPEECLVRLWKEAEAEIRLSMHGGRTDTRRMLKEWTQQEIEQGIFGKYQDVQSLYPTVQFYDPLPIGKPKKITCRNWQPRPEQLNNLFGFVCCDIRPTRYLHHPILVNVDDQTGRLVASLKPQKKIVVATPELHLALQHGYVVDHVYWWYQFDSSTELFKPYFREFIKKKIEASGRPAWADTREKFDEFLQYHENVLGIKIDQSNLQKNPSQKTGAKLLCNSLWGKFGERIERLKSDVYELGRENDSIIALENRWMDADLDIMHRRLTHDNRFTIMVYKILNKDFNFIAQGKHSRNIALASMITSHARCRLWAELNKLGSRVLYHDTDSIIYEHNPHKYNIPEGRFLGEWECETNNVPIVKFVSTGPKCYSYVLADGESCTKVKGFSLNSKNSDAINYNSMKSLVLNDDKNLDAETLQFKYDLKSGALTVAKIKKLFKVTYEKGFIDPSTTKVYPFGWRNFLQSLDQV